MRHASDRHLFGTQSRAGRILGDRSHRSEISNVQKKDLVLSPSGVRRQVGRTNLTERLLQSLIVDVEH
jgi:hypothetical protein